MKDCVWLKPERRCEVEFVERTAIGRLRHASFRQLVS
jgi:ATP-dependent DNA ligase